ncbi:16S rRNA (guanine(966)-N(2))-methyltransferase RsmD [Opitutae bacterium]|nr:16S rRNA (guanine(966)-N(2))-methyltransferase RsmD [Opitutae bacterium]
MRITGGKARGITLKSANGKNTRPATDRTRESLFASLANSIEDVNCVDLFAGSGSYGFEALSRGAKSCLFIEHNRTAIKCIKHNVQTVVKSAELKLEAIQIKQSNLLEAHSASNQQCFDFIFLDPPYTLWESQSMYLLDTLALSFANKTSQLIIECPSELKLDEISSHWRLVKRLGKQVKGKPNIQIYKKINLST